MGCKASFVLPTRGNTKLFQPQRFRQSLLRKGLLGEHCGESIRSLVALWRIEENKFLDLTQFLQQLLHRDAGPCRLGLTVHVLQQRDAQHAIERVDPDLTVRSKERR